jgi:PAS domain-containing protein
MYRIAGRDPKVPPPGLKEHSRFFTPESFLHLMEAIERAVHTGTSFALELDMVRADATIRSVTSRGEAERGPNGQVVLVRGSIHDVTEHKRAEDALRESEANLTKAQAIAHIGSWHLDVARDRLSWSDEVFRIFGVPPGRLSRTSHFSPRFIPQTRAPSTRRGRTRCTALRMTLSIASSSTAR